MKSEEKEVLQATLQSMMEQVISLQPMELTTLEQISILQLMKDPTQE